VSKQLQLSYNRGKKAINPSFPVIYGTFPSILKEVINNHPLSWPLVI